MKALVLKEYNRGDIHGNLPFKQGQGACKVPAET